MKVQVNRNSFFTATRARCRLDRGATSAVTINIESTHNKTQKQETVAHHTKQKQNFPERIGPHGVILEPTFSNTNSYFLLQKGGISQTRMK